MKYFLLLCAGWLLLACVNSSESDSKAPATEDFVSKIAFAVHGGAGTILKENMTDSLEAVYTQKLEEAVTTGYKVLQDGGTATDAVVQAIIILEDSPLFNAGKGAVFTHERSNELDASLMDGATLQAGAVTGLRHIKNPITLALAVMKDSPHVMLAGAGAEEFAEQQGIERVEPNYFYTEARERSLQNARRSERRGDEKFGTVGAVALDKKGNLAAGTSTGGMTNKRWNRIGDSPIIGAGTYANNHCAVSATGWGEFFIRSVAAYDIAALVEYKGLSLQEAARIVIHEKIPELGGDGGVIALDKEGNITTPFTTPGMYRASIDAEGKREVKMYLDEE